MIRSRKVVAAAFVFILLAGSRPAPGQTLKPGPQVLTFFSDVDDTEQPYGLYLPRNYSARKKYPLVVSLHGAGSNHRLNLRRVFGQSNREGETDVEATRYFPELRDVDFIVASPYARGTMGYQGLAEKDVYDVLADAMKRFSIDEDRIYLTGLSMGGGGTLWLGLTRPDLWAAIAPVCPAPPADAADLAGNALNLPIHIHQGGADPVVKPEGTRDWVKKLKELGTDVGYTEYPGVQHNSWENAYKNAAIFGWFAKFKRNRFPERVRFVTTRYKYDGAYWVWIDRLTPGTAARVDAKFAGPNRLEIATAGLEALTLRLAGHPKLKGGKPVNVLIDGQAMATRAAGGDLALVRRDGAWTAAKYEAPAGAKRKGAEGPLGEALSGRHIYVYGTAGNPTREESLARRDVAAKAADWSSARGRLMVFPRAIADREVRPSDLATSNLILFGTRETNALIEKFADRLPIQLDPAAASIYGLAYIFPIDGQYVVVCSGLPWWTPTPPPPAGAARRGGFAAGTALGLNAFQDFILFKDSPATPVAEGRFDADWRLSATDAEKLAASGVVQVRRGSILKSESFFPEESQTRRNDRRIVEDAPISIDFLEGGLDSQGGAVRPMGGHRLDDVGHRQNPGFEENVVPFQLLRIPGSVHPFVVLENHFGDGPGEFDFVEDVIADLGMGLDQRVFDLRENRRFAQDFGGDGHLPDVMNQAGHADSFHAFRGKP
jgi:predicted esterase